MRRRAFVVAMMMLALMVGCASQAHRRQVTVVIDRGGGAPPVTRYVEIAGYPTVLQVMTQAALIETVRGRAGGTWITAIDGLGEDRANVSWSFTVNGLPQKEAPSEVIVGPGEVIRWYAQ